MRFIIVLGSLLFVFLSLQAQNLTIPEEPMTALLPLEHALSLEEGLALEKVQIGENSEEVLHEKARQLAEDPDFQALVDTIIDKNVNKHLFKYVASQMYLLYSYGVIFLVAVFTYNDPPGFVNIILNSHNEDLKAAIFATTGVCIGVPSLAQFLITGALLNFHFSKEELSPKNYKDIKKYQVKLNEVTKLKNINSSINFVIPTVFIPTMLAIFFKNMKKDMRVYNAADMPLANSINSFEKYKNILMMIMIYIPLPPIAMSLVFTLIDYIPN
jgi:hypothetical protein